jgi:RNA-directed DNA polymerase
LGGGLIHSYFEYITSLENLLGAWREFKKRKNKKRDIQDFDFYLEQNLFSLHNELRNKTYVNELYTAFYVYDPKRRHIHKAQVRDRVVHQAVYRVLYSIYDKHFIHDSYSCRIDKGAHRGVERLVEFTRKESKNYTRNIWVLKCDISKFFDSINHVILKNIIFRKINDEDTK